MQVRRCVNTFCSWMLWTKQRELLYIPSDCHGNCIWHLYSYYFLILIAKIHFNIGCKLHIHMYRNKLSLARIGSDKLISLRLFPVSLHMGFRGCWRLLVGVKLLILILMWSVVFDTSKFRILSVYIQFEGAKYIHVLSILSQVLNTNEVESQMKTIKMKIKKLSPFIFFIWLNIHRWVENNPTLMWLEIFSWPV